MRTPACRILVVGPDEADRVRQGRDDRQVDDRPADIGSIDGGQPVERGVVGPPVEPDDEDADEEGDQLGALVPECVHEVVLRAGVGQRRNADTHDDQCQGDGEDGVREERDPVEAQLDALALVPLRRARHGAGAYVGRPRSSDTQQQSRAVPVRPPAAAVQPRATPSLTSPS